MRKTFTIFIILFFVAINLAGQWEIVQNRQPGARYIMDFINENVGWLPSDDYLLKTEDGGDTWIELVPHLENTNKNIGWFRSLDFINENLGWAIISVSDGYSARLVRTTNGGKTWVVQSSISVDELFVLDEMNIFLLDISFSNQSEVNTLVKTLDGGENWIDITPDIKNHHLSSINFISQDIGVVLTLNNENYNLPPGILRTIDGGNTWSDIIIPCEDEEPWIPSQYFSNFQFINDSTGYFSSDKKLFKTIDTCNTFFEIFSTPKGEFIMFNWLIFAALSDNTLYVLTDDSTNTYRLFYSNDGGFNWEIKCLIDYTVPIQMIFPNKETGYILETYEDGRSPEGSLILKTVDYGNNWETKLLGFPFNSVSFIKENRGIVCGVNKMSHQPDVNNLFITSDGGKSWQLTLKTESHFRKCLLYNNNSGLALTNNNLYRTTNSAESWQALFNGTIEYDFTDFYFLNEKNWWLIGNRNSDNDSNSVILRTTDGGINWQKDIVFGSEGRFINSIHIINEKFGWVVGKKINSNGSIAGLAIKYDYINGWTELPELTNLPLNEVFFVNEEIGFLLGGFKAEEYYSAIFLRTEDGGSSWEELNGIDYLLNDIYVGSNGIGFAIGEHRRASDEYWEESGVILSTPDFGKKWIVESENLNSALYALDIKYDFGIAVGNDGIILKTRFDSTTWIGSKQEIIALKFDLSQNYPNPFNPCTTIKYSIPKQCKVILKVYDILGSEVTTLVIKEQPQGNYEVEFDGSELTSGIYFYRLQVYSAESGADDFIETKKMILLK